MSAPAGTEPRAAEPLYSTTSINGLIKEDLATPGSWKILIGPIQQDCWTSPVYPNRSTDIGCDCSVNVRDCKDGCLFEIRSDPLEYEGAPLPPVPSPRASGSGSDIVARPDRAKSEPAILKQMQARLHEIKATAFLPDRGPVDTKASCGAAMGKWGGFWGPFVE